MNIFEFSALQSMQQAQTSAILMYCSFKTCAWYASARVHCGKHSFKFDRGHGAAARAVTPGNLCSSQHDVPEAVPGVIGCCPLQTLAGCQHGRCTNLCCSLVFRPSSVKVYRLKGTSALQVMLCRLDFIALLYAWLSRANPQTRQV